MEFPLTISADFLKRSHARRLFRYWPRITLAFVLIGMQVIVEDTTKSR